MLILKGHTAPVRCVAYSPDGRYLATGGDDRTLIVWDMSTGKAHATIQQHTDSVRAVSFTTQDGRLATGGWDSTLCIWTVPPRGRKPRLTKTLLQADWVWALAYAPDGWALAAGLGNGAIALYPSGPKAKCQTLRGHSYPVTHLAFSPNGNVLASAGQDRTVRLWLVEFGQPIATITGHVDWVRSVAFAPSGNLLASGGDDGRILLWYISDRPIRASLSEYQPLAVYLGHGGPIRSVAFSPDGRTLLSASWDGTVRVWEIPGGRECGVFDWQIGRVNDVAFSPDGMTAAAAGQNHTVVVWDIDTL
jgi:WD40 repeat protein